MRQSNKLHSMGFIYGSYFNHCIVHGTHMIVLPSERTTSNIGGHMGPVNPMGPGMGGPMGPGGSGMSGPPQGMGGMGNLR